MQRNCLSNALRKKDRNQAKNLLFGDVTDQSFPNCGGSFVWKGSLHIRSEHKSHEDTTILSVCRDAAMSQVSSTVWGTLWIWTRFYEVQVIISKSQTKQSKECISCETSNFPRAEALSCVWVWAFLGQLWSEKVTTRLLLKYKERSVLQNLIHTLCLEALSPSFVLILLTKAKWNCSELTPFKSLKFRACLAGSVRRTR